MRISLILFVILWTSTTAIGQISLGNGAPQGKDRWYFGGGLGLNGGTNTQGYRYFYVGLYPVVGYMLNEKTSVGTSLTWQHYEYPDISQTIDQYGFSPFIRYNLGQAFAYSEYMFLNSPTYVNSERKMYNRWLIGLGYSMPIGRRGAVNAMGLYDILYKVEDRAFASPWVFRIWFSF